MKLYLTRHGQTEWNLAGMMQGRLNSDLTILGIDQAKWLGDRLKDTPIDIICSSSSGRALDTAKYIKGSRPLDIESYDDLVEINVGHWQGMSHKDIEGNYAEAYNNFWHHPELFKSESQESFEDIINRAGNVLEKIVSEHQGKDILIVSHGVLLKGILAYVKKIGVKDFWTGPFMKSTCLNIIEFNQVDYQIILEGDTTHYV